MIEKIAARVLEKLARNRFETEYLKGNVSPQQYDSYVADPRLQTRSYNDRARGLNRGTKNIMSKSNIYDVNTQKINPKAQFSNMLNVTSGAPAATAGGVYSAAAGAAGLRNSISKQLTKWIPTNVITENMPVAVNLGSPKNIRLQEPGQHKGQGGVRSQINALLNRHEIDEVRAGSRQTGPQIATPFFSHAGPSVLAREVQNAKFLSPSARKMMHAFRNVPRDSGTGTPLKESQAMDAITGKPYDVAGDARYSRMYKMDLDYKNQAMKLPEYAPQPQNRGFGARVKGAWDEWKSALNIFGAAPVKDVMALPGQMFRNYFHGPAPLIIPK